MRPRRNPACGAPSWRDTLAWSCPPRTRAPGRVGRMSDAGAPAAEPGYLLDNAQAQAQGRFAGLEASFDTLTQRHLAARGLRPGWRCLEVGAGSGSVARSLASQAAPDGSVLATDIDTRWVDTGSLPNLEVIQHDIVTDPLPGGAFDLIHARLVAALKPGGWLVAEDFDSSLPHCLDPATDEEQAFVKVGQALVGALHRR